MDKYKVKNILIFVLIMLNCALFFVFYKIDTQDKIINNQTKANVVSILLSNNIKLDKKIIPENPNFFTGRYIERALDSNNTFISKLMGVNYETINQSTFKSGDKSLVFSGNMFDYTDKSPENPPPNFSETEIQKYCFKKMEELNINYKDYKYNGLNFNRDNVKAIFSPAIAEYEFFDSYISFEISSDGITAIQGKNVLISKPVPSISTSVYDIISVLLDLPSLPEFKSSKAGGIINIKLGYYIGSGEYRYNNVLAIPAWQIALDNGSIFYFDARNGKYID